MSKLLIIEDEDMISRMYHLEFSRAGYDLQMAAGGEAGIQLARKFDPDLILLDVLMPEVNGMQTLEKLKADPKLKDIPVAILSNLAGSVHIQRAMDLGAIRYIIKSENLPKQVEQIVRKLLEDHKRPGRSQDVKS
jgi:DNA-binding response OmpR family regulator